MKNLIAYILILIAGSSVFQAEAACTPNLTMNFDVNQTAQRVVVSFSLTQVGNSLTGRATGNGNGTVSGTLSDRHVNVTITWPNGQSGSYTWDIDDSGNMVHGKSIALSDPTGSSSLTSSGNFCK